MEDLTKKIQSMQLTKTDRRIADYILEHMDSMGFQTLTSLSIEIGISDTSIIRFIRKLGFRGYAEFRQEMGKRIAMEYSRDKNGLSLSEKFASTRESLQQESLIHDVMQRTMENLEKSLSKLDNETIHMIADLITESKRKYVVGFRGTVSCVEYMTSKLILLLPNVIPITHADATAMERLYDIGEDDCLILYSFPRYSELCEPLMDLARERKAKILLFPDRLTSPLASKADYVIESNVTGLGFANSYVVPLSVTEVILLAISGRADIKNNNRVQNLDMLMEEFKLY